MKKGDTFKEQIDKIVKPEFDRVIKSSKGNTNSEPVNKSSVPNDVYFSIINGIRAGLYPSKIAKNLKIKKQALSRYIKKLKFLGILDKKGYGTWEINEIKLKEFLKDREVNKSSAVATKDWKKVFTSKKEVRGHGFQITLKIPKIEKWEKRREYLEKNNIKYKPIGSNWKGERILIKGHKIWLTPVSIVFYAPEWKSWFAKTSKESQSHVIYDFLQLINRVENLLKVSFEINKKYRFKVTRQHYGLVKNALAIQYDKEGKKLACYAERGQWLIIDNSYNLHEIENTHPKTAVRDNKITQDFFNSLDKNPITIDQILQSLKGLTDNMTNLAEQQRITQGKEAFYAKHHESHAKAIIKLEKGINKLVDIKTKNPPLKPKKQRIIYKRYGLTKEEEKELKRM